MIMTPIRTAVIGIGHLGRFHAEKYAALPQSKLVAVCDINQDRCQEKAKELNTTPVYDYRSLVGLVDAVSIAVPTPIHHEVGCFFMNHGIHVLMEKPIATTLQEADDLINAAKKNKVILQVGHLERFNNAIKAAEPLINQPLFIESLRLAPFRPRGIDVNVILDLMIHDIDIIQLIVKSDIKAISANGAPVLSPYLDIANTRIEFANGCVANVTASRVHLKVERKLRVFQHDRFMSIDLNHKKIAIHRKGNAKTFEGTPAITREVMRLDSGDALNDQIVAFLFSIINQTLPAVSGEDAKRALATALEIALIVRRTNKEFDLPVGLPDNISHNNEELAFTYPHEES